MHNSTLLNYRLGVAWAHMEPPSPRDTVPILLLLLLVVILGVVDFGLAQFTPPPQLPLGDIASAAGATDSTAIDQSCPSGPEWDYTCAPWEKSKIPGAICVKGIMASSTDVIGICVGPGKAKGTEYKDENGDWQSFTGSGASNQYTQPQTNELGITGQSAAQWNQTVNQDGSVTVSPNGPTTGFPPIPADYSLALYNPDSNSVTYFPYSNAQNTEAPVPGTAGATPETVPTTQSLTIPPGTTFNQTINPDGSVSITYSPQQSQSSIFSSIPAGIAVNQTTNPDGSISFTYTPPQPQPYNAPPAPQSTFANNGVTSYPNSQTPPVSQPNFISNWISSVGSFFSNLLSKF